jgi:hypothetical protein
MGKDPTGPVTAPTGGSARLTPSAEWPIRGGVQALRARHAAAPVAGAAVAADGGRTAP